MAARSPPGHQSALEPTETRPQVHDRSAFSGGETSSSNRRYHIPAIYQARSGRPPPDTVHTYNHEVPFYTPMPHERSGRMTSNLQSASTLGNVGGSSGTGNRLAQLGNAAAAAAAAAGSDLGGEPSHTRMASVSAWRDQQAAFTGVAPSVVSDDPRLDTESEPPTLQSASRSGGRQDDSEEPRRRRLNTTPYQVHVLTEELRRNPFPAAERREQLARHLGMTPRRVQVWFQNRRQADRLARGRPPRWMENLMGPPYWSGLPTHFGGGFLDYPPPAPGMLSTGGLLTDPSTTFSSSFSHLDPSFPGIPSGLGNASASTSRLPESTLDPYGDDFDLLAALNEPLAPARRPAAPSIAPLEGGLPPPIPSTFGGRSALGGYTSLSRPLAPLPGSSLSRSSSIAEFPGVFGASLSLNSSSGSETNRLGSIANSRLGLGGSFGDLAPLDLSSSGSSSFGSLRPLDPMSSFGMLRRDSGLSSATTSSSSALPGSASTSSTSPSATTRRAGTRLPPLSDALSGLHDYRSHRLGTLGTAAPLSAAAAIPIGGTSSYLGDTSLDPGNHGLRRRASVGGALGEGSPPAPSGRELGRLRVDASGQFSHPLRQSMTAASAASSIGSPPVTARPNFYHGWDPISGSPDRPPASTRKSASTSLLRGALESGLTGGRAKAEFEDAGELADESDTDPQTGELSRGTSRKNLPYGRLAKNTISTDPSGKRVQFRD